MNTIIILILSIFAKIDLYKNCRNQLIQDNVTTKKILSLRETMMEFFIFKNSFSNTDIKDEACQYSYKTRGISFQGMTLKYWGNILFHVQW